MHPYKRKSGAGDETRTRDINLGKVNKFFNKAANSGSTPTEYNLLVPGDTFNPHRQFHGTWTPRWLEERLEISERAKKLYSYLTYFAGGKGKAWPSYNTLAEKLHVTRRHVIRILYELSKHKLVKVTHANDPIRGHRANVYEFLWHEWMVQHPHDKNFRMAHPKKQPPLRRVASAPLSLSNENSDTKAAPQLPHNDIHVTRLVTQVSPRSQENKEKRLNYKHPTSPGTCNLITVQTTSLPNSKKPTRHSTALVRKAWQVSRHLLNEFWDNCKIRPDLRILFGYTSRALCSGYQEKSILDAFERSLHLCHSHATDRGEVWEVSSTVHRAEKWLQQYGTLWQPPCKNQDKLELKALRR